ncbi:zinc ABC transporter substrate-binding protein [Citreimonas salinaria]|uniref:High-affinity zinc uptake system protein ZnuA n=1 Tax=Citreimonas salinaria TaxID=321339 RepID=A0A1H3FGT1_9RHOB|nr:zinc ABC transporter substrate-binding protein [Citreimonas salinaria]SDX89967.1 zinc transport system substrate-binding protein [Citreimonas salinaria]
MTRLPSFCVVLAACATLAMPARADVPHVVADIAPVHALVLQVMEGVGQPDLLLPRGSDPHGHALRPSEARALSQADVVVWIGDALTPSVASSIDTLAAGADSLPLLDVAGTTVLAFREDALFGAAHGDEDHGEDEDVDHGHDAHSHDEPDHGHDHSGADPHAWLDPRNAIVWLDAIAETLAEQDPANAATYRANAEAAQAAIAETEAEIAAELADAGDLRFVVYHDAFQYFEARFGLRAAGALSLADDASPSAARLATIRDAVRAGDIQCAVAEPQYDAGLIAAVFEDTAVETVIVDPAGADLEPGPDFYAQLLRVAAAGFGRCD